MLTHDDHVTMVTGSVETGHAESRCFGLILVEILFQGFQLLSDNSS